MKIWWPYTNQDLDESETSPEHIIPLSLGGCDDFAIPVDKKFNSTVGSEIDGKYANDFLVMLRRNAFDVRGHSKKRPIPIVKKGSMEDGRCVQINMDKASEFIEIYDPRSKKTLAAKGGEKIGMSIKMDTDIYLQLTSKIALSAGYFIYGEWFKNNVYHNDLRILMKGLNKCSKEELKSVKTKIFNFLSANVPDDQRQELELQKALCKALKGSLVAFTPGPRNIGITVGILGEFVGMVNIPANIDGFPRNDADHDLGHVVTIVD